MPCPGTPLAPLPLAAALLPCPLLPTLSPLLSLHRVPLAKTEKLGLRDPLALL